MYLIKLRVFLNFNLKEINDENKSVVLIFVFEVKLLGCNLLVVVYCWKNIRIN